MNLKYNYEVKMTNLNPWLAGLRASLPGRKAALQYYQVVFGQFIHVNKREEKGNLLYLQVSIIVHYDFSALVYSLYTTQFNL